MRFMTYNIKLGLLEGLAPIVDIIRAAEPDVLALQEVGCNWRTGPPGDTTARVAHQTGLDSYVYATTLVEADAFRYGHALLSRWPIRNARRFELTHQSDEPRVVLSSDVVTSEGRWRVVSTHLSHIRDERAVQGPEFRHLLQQFRARTPADIPLVAAGDWNEPRAMPAPWFRDVLADFDEAGRLDDTPTFENPAPDQRIDYLLIAGKKWMGADVPAEDEASDHRPVIADA